ncbi:TetR family transcriptional regulator [Catellatospora sp. TT07R-123]|uniref:TetR/AcrR family transcriptional regulator n=1 Tax=Catellatospora sp. TT07R-123 TaxID=2733863 RepID=UPI001B241ADF|nr:TetR/AcrR family transcriptional regulator [Catellatospora sp. TT07R-123]GHJ49593.1 TetR family transcriptional regulator [Catellatospora sp. TT07R-123]
MDGLAVPRAGLSTGGVVEAALALVDEQGAGALTLAAVAARTGVATPSLYKHVRGLDALEQLVSAAVTEQFAGVLERAAAGRAGADALRAVAAAYRAYAHDLPGRYPFAQRVPDQADPAHAAAGQRAVGAIFAVLHGYGIEGDAAVDATRMLRSTLHGFVSLELAGGFGLPQSVDRSFDRLVDGADAALQAWPRQS